MQRETGNAVVASTRFWDGISPQRALEQEQGRHGRCTDLHMEQTPRSRLEARARSQERLARMERRHQGSWSLGSMKSVLLFMGLLVASPWLIFAVFDKDGWHTSPGLRGLILLTAGVVLFACRAGYRASKSKLWRAQRRRPWWLRHFRAGPALSCAYCRDDLAQGGEVSCPDCGGSYHAECQAELGRCASLGCGGLGEATAPRRAPGKSPLRSKGALTRGAPAPTLTELASGSALDSGPSPRGGGERVTLHTPTRRAAS